MKKYINTIQKIKASEELKQETAKKLSYIERKEIIDSSEEKKKWGFQMNIKKYVIISLTAVILICCGVFIPLIILNSKNQFTAGNIELSASMFSGYKAEFGNSASLGIINRKLSPQRANANNIDDDKNHLVGFDENNEIIEVIFTKIAPNGENGDILTQSQIKAQIDKLYVAKDYIYFTLTNYIKTNRTEDKEDYDQIDYVCEKNIQSFLIDRNTKNIYSLAALPNISSLENKIACVEDSKIKSYYMLSIENDQIKFTDLVPNKNIIVSNVQIDKNGIVFVENDSVNLITNDAVYYIKPDFDSEYRYGLGDDGNFYKVRDNTGQPGFIVLSLQVFDSGGSNHKWTCPTDLLPVTIAFDFGNWGVEDYCFLLIKHGKIYIIYYDYCIYEYEFTDSQIQITELIDVVCEYPRWNPKVLLNTAFIAGENIYYITNGEIHVYVTTSYEQSLLGIKIAENISKIEEITNSYIIAISESINGTKKYKIYVNENNEVKCELFSDVVYDVDIIVIKPL